MEYALAFQIHRELPRRAIGAPPRAVRLMDLDLEPLRWKPNLYQAPRRHIGLDRARKQDRDCETVQRKLAADFIFGRAADHRKIDEAERRQQALQHQPGPAVPRRRHERMSHDLGGIDLYAPRQRMRRRHVETDALGADDFGRDFDFLTRRDEETDIGVPSRSLVITSV